VEVEHLSSGLAYVEYGEAASGVGDGGQGADSRHDGAVDGERKGGEIDVAAGPAQREVAEVDVLAGIVLRMPAPVGTDGDGVSGGAAYPLAEEFNSPGGERVYEKVTECVPADGAADGAGACKSGVDDGGVGGGTSNQ
jgi:hypothetical protein